jgi:hypothetical protein
MVYFRSTAIGRLKPPVFEDISLQGDPTMAATRIYALLQEACAALEASEDHAIAAYVGFAMALVEEKYGVGHDHLESVGCD